MTTSITGAAIKRLREAKGITQAALAEEIGVSAKAISKWETARGLPDIALLEPLAKVLGVSVLELMSGDTVSNQNRAGNLLRSKFYVCPVCGNVLYAAGESVVSCCGQALPPLEAVETDSAHRIVIEDVEDEQFIRIDHEMSKEHFLSFVAFVTLDRLQLVKLYPEGGAETRLSLRGGGLLYLYCTRHGLMKQSVGKRQNQHGSGGAVAAPAP